MEKVKNDFINFIREVDEYVLPERKIISLCILCVLSVICLMILPEAKIAGFVAIVTAGIAAIFRAVKK